MLHRLEAEGLFTAREIVVDGKARRLSRGTPAGRRAFADRDGAVGEPPEELLDR